MCALFIFAFSFIIIILYFLSSLKSFTLLFLPLQLIVLVHYNRTALLSLSLSFHIFNITDTTFCVRYLFDITVIAADLNYIEYETPSLLYYHNHGTSCCIFFSWFHLMLPTLVVNITIIVNIITFVNIRFITTITVIAAFALIWHALPS